MIQISVKWSDLDLTHTKLKENVHSEWEVIPYFIRVSFIRKNLQIMVLNACKRE